MLHHLLHHHLHHVHAAFHHLRRHRRTAAPGSGLCRAVFRRLTHHSAAHRSSTHHPLHHSAAHTPHHLHAFLHRLGVFVHELFPLGRIGGFLQARHDVLHLLHVVLHLRHSLFIDRRFRRGRLRLGGRRRLDGRRSLIGVMFVHPTGHGGGQHQRDGSTQQDLFHRHAPSIGQIF